MDARAEPLGLTRVEAERRRAELGPRQRVRGSRGYARSSAPTSSRCSTRSSACCWLIAGARRLPGCALRRRAGRQHRDRHRAGGARQARARPPGAAGRAAGAAPGATASWSSSRVDELVAGDAVRVEPGDQVVADGRLAASRALSVDESILTGESEPVVSDVGEQVLSGAYCVAGAGELRRRAVGADSFAERLALEARGTRDALSPLQQDINRVLRVDGRGDGAARRAARRGAGAARHAVPGGRAPPWPRSCRWCRKASCC